MVTGGLGFIGSNFILHALERLPYVKIVNVDAELDGSNRNNLASIKNEPRYRFIKGNITNQKVVDKLVANSDMVFNFAEIGRAHV